MKIKAGPPNIEPPWLEVEDDEEVELSLKQREIRVIVSRAVIVYLVLFMTLALIMSTLGTNPLVHNGLMPKGLLVFIGLALIMALANHLADFSREYRQSWWNVARGLVHLAPNEKLEE